MKMGNIFTVLKGVIKTKKIQIATGLNPTFYLLNINDLIQELENSGYEFCMAGKSMINDPPPSKRNS